MWFYFHVQALATVSVLLSANSGRECPLSLHMTWCARSFFCEVMSFHTSVFTFLIFQIISIWGKNDIVTTKETAFKSGTPVLLSGRCGAVTVLLSLPSRASLCEACLCPSEGVWRHHFLLGLCICRLCSFSSNCKYIQDESKVSPECLNPSL